MNQFKRYVYDLCAMHSMSHTQATILYFLLTEEMNDDNLIPFFVWQKNKIIKKYGYTLSLVNHSLRILKEKEFIYSTKRGVFTINQEYLPTKEKITNENLKIIIEYENEGARKIVFV